MDKGMDIPANNINAFIDRPVSRVHKFYITQTIKESSEYTSWFETIRNAGENDVIVFHINSYGGDLFTAIQFMRVIRETKAAVVASVEGACMSAATIIFLTANHWEVSDHSMFMFHNYSGGSIGKGGEMYDHIAHERVWSDKLLRDVYADFLTKQEVDSLLNNKDIWMSGDEAVKRLQIKAKKNKGTLKDNSKQQPTTKKKTPTKKPPKKAAPKKN
jgi:ATP-dependent protease ClpP protease subunit